MIVIADSHTLYRDALCRYLRHAAPEEEIVEAEGMSALSINAAGAELILLGYDMPEAGEVIAKWAAKTVLFTNASEAAFPVKARFPRTLSSKAVLQGVRALREGREVTFANADAPSHETARPVSDAILTAREKDVMGHLLRGASNKEIARALDLQVVTIKLHVRGICRKLNAANRTQAALIAKESGWT